MGFDKLSADLNGRPVAERSLQAFQDCDEVTEIVVVTSKERIDFFESFGIAKVAAIVEGGSERHESVRNGLAAVERVSEAALIAVHDAARPLIQPRAISRCAGVARESGAASLAHRIVDTLKRSGPGEAVARESVDRTDLWAMQTPQIFSRTLLQEAYREVARSGQPVTDEVSALQLIGHDVVLVENTSTNLKITVPADLEIAAALLGPG